LNASSLYVVGTGQLGAMFRRAASTMGLPAVAIEPAELADPAAAQRYARGVVTVEFENTGDDNIGGLARFARAAPSIAAIDVCRHRAKEKAHFLACGVPTVPHWPVDEGTTLPPAGWDGGEAILKTATQGYDGKGQLAVKRPEDLRPAWESLHRVPCLLEKRVELHREFSVIVARDARGDMVQLPVQQNLHLNGILAVTRVPAVDIPDAAVAQASEFTRRLAAGLDYQGVLCVEYFLLRDGSVLANEMAPRPHNSGHYSIDACDVSQFELQVRVLAGWPLVTPRRHSAAVMLNLLGDLWLRGPGGHQQPPDWSPLLAMPGVHLHLYGKQEARPGRKMGHLTITAADVDSSLAVARQAAAALGIVGP
jgi:5-(carboxyamino)imidazole ribonucleotide synthase